MNHMDCIRIFGENFATKDTKMIIALGRVSADFKIGVGNEERFS